MTADLNSLASEPFCYVTTMGRRSGNPHEIEIWFGLRERTLYILSGGGDRSDWVRNIAQNAGVSVRIARQTLVGQGRIVSNPHEDALARMLLLEKYSATYIGDLSDWGRTALPVAIDLEIG